MLNNYKTLFQDSEFEDAKLIAEKMYKIPCLKFQVEKYKKFLEL